LWLSHKKASVLSLEFASSLCLSGERGNPSNAFSVSFYDSNLKFTGNFGNLPANREIDLGFNKTEHSVCLHLVFCPLEFSLETKGIPLTTKNVNLYAVAYAREITEIK
jgi:hypothetical protein